MVNISANDIEGYSYESFVEFFLSLLLTSIPIGLLVQVPLIIASVFTVVIPCWSPGVERKTWEIPITWIKIHFSFKSISMLGLENTTKWNLAQKYRLYQVKSYFLLTKYSSSGKVSLHERRQESLLYCLHRIIDGRMDKYGSIFVFISK